MTEERAIYVKTPLGLNVKTTPVFSDAEEFVSLLDDLKDLKDKIDEQERKLLRSMEAAKKYEIRIGGYVLRYDRIEEQKKIKKAKDKEYNGGM